MESISSNQISVETAAVINGTAAGRQILMCGFAALFLLFASNGSFSFQGSGHATAIGHADSALVNVQTEDQNASRHETLFLWESAAVILVAFNFRRCVFCVRKHLALVLVPVISVLSVLWSENRALTIRSAIPFVLCTAAVFAFCTLVKGQDRIRVLALCGLIAAVGSIVVAVAMPAEGQDYVDGLNVWRGIFTDKNICALAMALFFAAAMGRPLWRTRVMDLSLVLLCIVVLYYTQSRTGWIIAALVVVVKGGLKLLSKFRGRDTLISFVLVALFVVAALATFSTDYNEILKVLGKDATFTGRIPIWIGVWKAILSHPFLGYGYSAFWSGLRGPSAQLVLSLGWMVPHAHDGFLDLWLSLGLAGLVPFAVSLVIVFRNAATCLGRGANYTARWYITVLVIVLAYNISEVSLTLPVCFGWVCYLIACVGLEEEAHLVRRGE